MISPLEMFNLENCSAIYVLLSQYMLSQPTITKPIQLKVQDNAKVWAKNGPQIWTHCKSLMIMWGHTQGTSDEGRGMPCLALNILIPNIIMHFFESDNSLDTHKGIFLT